MKLKKIVLVLMLIVSIHTNSFASKENIIEEQSELLNIKSFVSEANSYTKNISDNIDVGQLLNDAIKGQIDNKGLLKIVTRNIWKRDRSNY